MLILQRDSTSQPATGATNLDSEIAALGTNLAALQDIARSLPAGVTMPLDRRSVFAELEVRVNRQFDRLSYVLAVAEGDMLD